MWNVDLKNVSFEYNDLNSDTIFCSCTVLPMYVYTAHVNFQSYCCCGDTRYSRNFETIITMINLKPFSCDLWINIALESLIYRTLWVAGKIRYTYSMFELHFWRDYITRLCRKKLMNPFPYRTLGNMRRKSTCEYVNIRKMFNASSEIPAFKLLYADTGSKKLTNIHNVSPNKIFTDATCYPH